MCNGSLTFLVVVGVVVVVVGANVQKLFSLGCVIANNRDEQSHHLYVKSRYDDVNQSVVVTPI